MKSTGSRQEERNILHAIKIRKSNWIWHILCRNCLIKYTTDENIEGRRRRGRRLKQLHDDFKETWRR